MGKCFLLPKIKKCTSADVFLGVFSDFSGQLSASSEQPLRRTKNVTTAFPDNLRSSHQVFFEIADLKHLRKIPGNHALWSVLLANFFKKIHRHQFFLWNFLEFSRTAILTLPADLLQEKTVTTASEINPTKSHREMFFKIAIPKRFEKIPRKSSAIEYFC